MTEEKKDVVIHEYDGIRELDNPMPRWWVGLFVAGVIYGAGYYAWYQLGDGRTIEQEFQAEKGEIEARVLRSSGGSKGPEFEAKLLAAIKSPEARKNGREVFAGKCVACHGPDGGGSVGPNLTDDYWLHGAKPAEIARVVSEGVPDKGMPPWGPLLKEGELPSVVAYVRSLHGTRPANPKAPQGALVKE